MDNVEQRVQKARGEQSPEQSPYGLEASVLRQYRSMFGARPSYYRYIMKDRNSINSTLHIVEVDGFRLSVPDRFLDFAPAWRLVETRNPLFDWSLSPWQAKFTLDEITPWHLKRRRKRLKQHERRTRALS